MPTQITAGSQLLTYFEYEIFDSLSEREARAVTRLSQSVGVDILKPVLRQGKVCFQARQFVGIVRLGQRTLQIWLCRKNTGVVD